MHILCLCSCACTRNSHIDGNSSLASTVSTLQGLVTGLCDQVKKLQEGRNVSGVRSGLGGYMPIPTGGSMEKISEQVSDSGIYHVMYVHV